MKHASTVQPSGRLASLDILRGFDLFLLVFFQPVFMALARQLDWPWLNPLVTQFTHVYWEGFHLWDLVMPLFMFMAGASMPFSLAKYKDSPNKGPIYRKIGKRFVLLFILGMVVQGNLLGLDPMYIYPYSNTLQAIATGYVIAAVVLLNCSFKWQVAVTALLLLVYWVPMTFWGDFTPEGNFAEKGGMPGVGTFSRRHALE